MLVRGFRKRHGAKGVVEAYGEVLFLPGGEVGRWQQRFSQRVRAFTAQAAPTNKRPRWAHYGPPLKTTFRASTKYQPGRMRVYSIVGSGAVYSAYVDQGTGIYSGRGPYEAKILPPWWRGSPSLYESTWEVPRNAGVYPDGTPRIEWGPVGPLLIKGQKGQHYFDEGLKRGFQSMRMRSFQLPAEGASKMTEALRSVPSTLEGAFLGPLSTPAFMAQLQEWRAWRDAAWDAKKILGPAGGHNREVHRRTLTKHRSLIESLAKRRARAAARARKYRRTSKYRSARDARNKRNAAKVKTVTANKSRPKRGWTSVRDKQTAAIDTFLAQNPSVELVRKVNGGIVVRRKGSAQTINIPWAKLYQVLG